MPRLGLTHGDINGISYEIILKAFADARILTLLTPVLYGQSKVLSYYKKNFGIEDFNYFAYPRCASGVVAEIQHHQHR
jgi:4-hydroxythreonine-4-phosphate dehydrogenase